MQGSDWLRADELVGFVGEIEGIDALHVQVHDTTYIVQGMVEAGFVEVDVAGIGLADFVGNLG